MLTLAIDTADETCAIALGKDNLLLCEYHFHSRMSLLKRLLPNVDRILADSGQTVKELTGLAVSLGPGSFTGLRIGVTTAKSLAYTLRIPIVGIGTLRALAHASAPSCADCICPMIHARAAEVYWSLFDPSAHQCLAEPSVGPVSSALKAALERGRSVLFCGSGALKNSDAIRHTFGSRATIGGEWTAFTRGAALLELGELRLREGISDDPLSLAPLYIRKPTPVVRLETHPSRKP